MRFIREYHHDFVIKKDCFGNAVGFEITTICLNAFDGIIEYLRRNKFLGTYTIVVNGIVLYVSANSEPNQVMRNYEYELNRQMQRDKERREKERQKDETQLEEENDSENEMSL